MKSIILSAVMAIGAFSAQAQDTKKFEFGVKAGANLSTLTGDFEDAEVMAGFHIGGLANYHFDDSFSLQPELLFSMQGASSGFESTDGVADIDNVRVELMYLNMPILAKYHLKNVKGLSFGFGPQVGLLLSAKQKYDATIGNDTDEKSNDVKDDVKPIDFGVVGDVEYKLPINLFFSLRGNVGLLNINDDGSGDKTHNSVVSLSAGYRF